MKTPIIVSSNPVQAWDKQEWETPEMYQAFSIYLSLRPPRSLRNCYIKYLEMIKGLSKTDAYLEPLTPIFINWSNGYDDSGNIKDYYLNWFQRASAYDDEQYQSYKKQLKGAQIDTVYREIRDVEAISTHWEVLYQEMQDGFDKLRKECFIKGISYDNSMEIMKLKDLFELREKIGNFKRRAVMLPARYDNAENMLDKADNKVISWWDEPPKQITEEIIIEEVSEAINE